MITEQILAVGIAVVGFTACHQAKNLACGDQSQVSYVTDFSDKRRLAGFSDDVFVGVVSRVRGQHSPDGIAETLFDVQVKQVLKGSLSGNVVVNQEGGCDESLMRKRRLSLTEGDSLLVVGREYLFATRHHSAGNWNTLVPRYGDVPLPTPDVKARIVSDFQAAIKNQIQFDPRIDPAIIGSPNVIPPKDS
jgi:hypothetical protein